MRACREYRGFLEARWKDGQQTTRSSRKTPYQLGSLSRQRSNSRCICDHGSCRTCHRGDVLDWKRDSELHQGVHNDRGYRWCWYVLMFI